MPVHLEDILPRFPYILTWEGGRLSCNPTLIETATGRILATGSMAVENFLYKPSYNPFPGKDPCQQH